MRISDTAWYKLYLQHLEEAVDPESSDPIRLFAQAFTLGYTAALAGTQDAELVSQALQEFDLLSRRYILIGMHEIIEAPAE